MQRGELYWCDFGYPRGAEQAYIRPALIVQANALQNVWHTILVVPFTSQVHWKGVATTVSVAAGTGGLSQDSVALCHQLSAVDKMRIRDRIGVLPAATLTGIEDAIIRTMNL
jgi:mRNA interferase MazF